MVMFCPKCGSLLKPKTDKKKKTLGCSCGFVSKESSTLEIKENLVKDKKKLTVIEDETPMLPETEANCPECRHDKAYFWTQQMRAGDEPETKFLKCKK